MYQIDSSGSVTTQPTPAAAGTPGFFTNGNPATGVAATILDADWFNAVQSELVNVLAAAGLTPTKGTNNQLLAAINTLFASSIATGSNANGWWRKLPNGSIEQWGTGTTASGTAAITFPIPFPSECNGVTPTESNASSWSASNLTVYGTASKSLTGAVINSLTWNGTAFITASGGSFFWRAVGR
ncbi:hypothetical protein SAMN05446927_5412 [Caballeronia arationis]|uniref:Putative tail fiber protein gp53-like C-terminal domain-containing protein n=1 Tax=Caballeronia arationis TaxID=1777142 RepID=A0A7Z7IB65_9BURK|nr:hypothetical protein [Caballeronia arationis]SOE82101.1 hypothetical protein SAMN05446927_5412 [Caballeronia arationis]